MKKEELLKKDWQLLTAYSEMTSISYLRTIMENQAVIISELKKIPIENVLKKMNEYQNDNYSKVVKMVKENIQDYPKEGREY